MSQKPPIVILGGGIIGCSTAYYLAKRGVPSIIIEQSGVASGASGKAGGFLAADWNDGGVGTLATKSYKMHSELESELGITIDYRQMETLSVKLDETGCVSTPQRCPEWLTGPVSSVSSLGTSKTTAQVHPYKLTQAFLQKAQDLVSCELRKAKVTGVHISNKNLESITLEGGDTLPCPSGAVFCMGPWSSKALEWLGLPSHLICGHRAHSIVLRPSVDIPAQALFTETLNATPEVYPRPDGTVYICGLGDDVPLPESPSQVEPEQHKISLLLKVASTLSKHLTENSAHLEESQCCFLPISCLHGPIMCEVPKVKGAFLCTGHSCWGILNAPASGLLMSELILDGKCSFMDASCFECK